MTPIEAKNNKKYAIRLQFQVPGSTSRQGGLCANGGHATKNIPFSHLDELDPHDSIALKINDVSRMLGTRKATVTPGRQ